MTQQFWRDPELPFIEVRLVRDGRKVAHSRHWHETFSVGIITSGRSSYGNGTHVEVVETGAIVVMNPGDVHVCNAVDGSAWSYLMFYFDAEWTGRIQAELRGGGGSAFCPYATPALYAPQLAEAGTQLFAELTDKDSDRLQREVSVVDFVGLLDGTLATGAVTVENGSKAKIAANYIDAHFAAPLRLADICAEANLSGSYLIRAFKKRYGVAPHEYQTNRRIQFAKARLRERIPLAQIAQEAGFADQAHFQRIFKRLTAATPGQYKG
ncbi:MAG: AraC family transcriptional regulator [Telluria sp.]